MPRSRRLKLYEYVADLVESGGQVLVDELQLEPDQARTVMLKVARAVCLKNAKSTVYIPEAANLANVERNGRIWAEYQLDNPEPPYTRKFTPARSQELAVKYDLSPQQIYNILRGEHHAEVSSRQGDLLEN